MWLLATLFHSHSHTVLVICHNIESFPSHSSFDNNLRISPTSLPYPHLYMRIHNMMLYIVIYAALSVGKSRVVYVQMTIFCTCHPHHSFLSHMSETHVCYHLLLHNENCTLLLSNRHEMVMIIILMRV